MTRIDLTPFYRSAIGFDRMANLVDNLFHTSEAGNTNFPPYNIEKIGETDYRITMAVAGFGENELDVTIHDGTLIITGRSEQEAVDDDKTFLYRGIAGRQFERQYNLHIRVKLKKRIKMWEKRFSEAKFQRNITCLWPGREVLCRCYPNVISKWQW